MGHAKLAGCMQACRDCAEHCWFCSSYMARESRLPPGARQLCAKACDICAEECRNSGLDYGSLCEQACRHCAEECRKVAA
jgi:hypothetical protein